MMEMIKAHDERTELLVDDEFNSDIFDITNKSTAYCSLKPTTEDEEIVLFNAMTNPTKRLGDCINTVITISHIFCEIVDCTNKETGEVQKCPRVVLISPNGESYHAVSLGVFNALKKIFAIKGEPNNWTSPVNLRVKQITRGERKMLTFEMVKNN